MNSSEDKRKEEKIFDPLVKAYLRQNGEIYVHAVSKLRGIAGVPSEPFLAQTIDDGLEDMGKAVLLAKKGSSSYIDRENYLDFVPPYVEWAGVKNTTQFVKNTKLVLIVFKSDQILFHAHLNKRGRWHALPDKDKVITIGSTSEQIGEQLLGSFEDSIA